MKTLAFPLKHKLITALLTAIAAVAACLAVYWYNATVAFGQVELGVCTVTESKVSIGDQATTSILSDSSSRQWAIIRQPINATNTVALSTGSGATIGSGYELVPGNDYAAGHASTTDEFRLGFSTELRTDQGLTAITDEGSTTVNVIDCK